MNSPFAMSQLGTGKAAVGSSEFKLLQACSNMLELYPVVCYILLYYVLNIPSQLFSREFACVRLQPHYCYCGAYLVGCILGAVVGGIPTRQQVFRSHFLGSCGGALPTSFKCRKQDEPQGGGCGTPDESKLILVYPVMPMVNIA